MLRDEKWRVKIDTTSTNNDSYIVLQDGLEQIKTAISDKEITFLAFQDENEEITIIKKELLEKITIKREED